MEFIQVFKNYLSALKPAPSKVTVKNYSIDVKHFLSWLEEKKQQSVDPKTISFEDIENFIKESNSRLSTRSLDRHVSSLRKFFLCLKLEGIISNSPFDQQDIHTKHIEADPYRFKQFKDFLYVYNASNLTIKNYIIDVKQFFAWAEAVLGVTEHDDKTTILPSLSSSLIEEYKDRLASEKVFSYASINRKLSSLRKYISWANSQNLLTTENGLQMNPNTITNISSTPLALLPKEIQDSKTKIQEEIKSEKQESENELRTTNYELLATSYSHFPPLRLAQKITKGISYAFDGVFTAPLAHAFIAAHKIIWIAKGKPLFTSVKTISNFYPKGTSFAEAAHFSIFNQFSKFLPQVTNIKKSFYAPLAISTKDFPWYKKLAHHARYTRPNWYKRYHSYAIAHYFNWAILMILMTVLGFGFYSTFIQKPGSSNPLLAAASPPRILSFQGRLTDNSNNPITTTTQLRFAIYDSISASGSALKWQEVDTITPDANGVFSVLLGNSTSIPQSLFANNTNLFLGIAVGQTPELTPRQQLATVAYATNAETLQGLPPITQGGAGTTNVVLALDSTGNLTIGAASTFQTVGGGFTLSGDALLLNTNAGTNGNVTIAPDGHGYVDLQKPLQNTTNNNNIVSATGSVEVDDTFAILATSSGIPAQTINQDGTGDLFTASTSGVSKFTIGNNGSITATNYNTAGGILFTNGTGVFLQTAAGTLGECLTSAGGGTPTWGTCGSGGTANGFWTLNAGSLYPVNNTVDFFVGGSSTDSAKFSVLNVNSGTPTASVSSGLNGNATFLTANGTLETSRNQGLTLGGPTTGNIILSPLNGTGTVTFAGYTTGIIHSTNGLLSSSSVNLASADISGILPLTNGGTNANLTPSNGGIVWSNATQLQILPAAGSAGQCLLSGGAGAPSWLNCSTAAQNFWTSNNGALYPINSTLDLLLGGSGATTSAKFSVLNLANGTPTASVSSGLNGFATFITSDGTLQTTRNQGLTLGGSSTGNITLSPSNGSGFVTVNGTINSNLVPTLNDTYNLGSPTNEWNNLYVRNIISGGNYAGFWQRFNGVISPTNITDDLSIGGTATNTAKFQVFGNTGNATTTGTLTFINNGSQIQTTSNQTLTLGGDTTGGIVLSPNNGTGTVTINGTTLLTSATIIPTSTAVNLGSPSNYFGNAYITNLFTSNASQYFGFWQRFNGALSPTNNTDDLIIGGTSTSSAKFQVFGNTGNATTAGNLVFTGTGSQIQTTSNQTLTLGGDTTGGIVLSPNNGTGSVTIAGLPTGVVHSTSGLLSSSAVLLGSEVSGILPILNGGTNTSSLGAAGSIAFSNGTNYAFTGVGTTGDCLVSNGSGTPNWTSCSSAASSSYWNLDGGLGILYPKNSTVDVLFGGDSTASANFAFINNAVGSGVPTASISGNLTLNSTGFIQTTNNQLLTIGGDTTGNITLSPLNGSGTVTINGASLLSSNPSFNLFTNTTALGIGSAAGTTTVNNALTSTGTLTASGILDVTGTTNLNGDVNLGNAPGDSIVANGTFASSLIPSTTDTYDLGSDPLSGGQEWNNLYVKNIISSGNISGFWQRNLGALSPTSITDDLLIGGTATSTAKFQIFSNSGNATTTGTLTFINNGSQIQTTSNQTLTLGGDTTGGITLSPNNGSGIVTVNGTGLNTTSSTFNLLVGATTLGIGGASGTTTVNNGLTVTGTTNLNGLINLGNATGDTITATGFFGSSLIPSTTDLYDLGSNPVTGGQEWNNLYVKNIISTGTVSGFWQLNGGALSPTNITNDLLVGGTSTLSAKFQIFGNTGNATTTGTLTFNGNGTIQTTNNTPLTLGGSSTGNIILSPNNGNGAITINGKFNSSLIPLTNNTYDLGSPSLQWNNVYANNLISNGTISGFWQRNLGLISPTNISDDLSIGGTATASSKFQIFGNTGNATTAGTLTFNTNGLIQTTSMLPLVLGSATTGSVELSPKGTTGLFVNGNGNVGVQTLNPTAVLDVNGAASVSSSLTFHTGSAIIQATSNNMLELGGNTTGGVVFDSNVASNLLPKFTNTFDLGSPSLQWNNVYAGNIYQNGQPIFASWQRNLGVLSPLNITDDLAIGGTSTNSAKFQVFGDTGNATTAGTLTFNGNGTIQTTNNTPLTLGGSSTGNIILSPNSGNGIVTINGTINSDLIPTTTDTYNLGSPTNEWNSLYVRNIISGGNFAGFWQRFNGVISPTNITDDLSIGGTATNTAKFQVFGDTGNATTTGTLTFTNGGSQIQTTSNQTLTLGGSTTGNIVLSPNNGTGTVTLNGYATGIIHSTAGLLSSSAINLASGDVSGILPLSKGGTSSNLTADDGGIVYSDASSLQILAHASVLGQCLLSGGLGAPTWGNCTTGGGNNWWNVAAGALYPTNETLDLLIGSPTGATASAKFAVINMTGSGTPTASVSSGLNGTGTYITADGTLQTTNNQGLTLGGPTTGNITLSPLNGAGSVTVNGVALNTTSSTFDLLTNATTLSIAAGSGTTTVNNALTATGTLTGSGNVVLGTNGTNTIAANGQFTTSLIPNIDNSFDLGQNSTPLRWRNLFLSGNSTIGGSETVTGSVTAGNLLLTSAANYGGFLQRFNGVLSPTNIADDLAVGGTATNTAKFQIFADTGNATTSGNLTFNGNGTIQTTNNQLLTLGGNTTGGIVFGSNVASNILPKFTNTYDLGSLPLQWNNLYANNIYANGQPLTQVWQRNAGVLSPLAITDDVAVGGTATTSAKFQIFGDTGNATTTGTLTFTANGIIQTTSMLPLVLGSATTGSIQLSPKGTSGLFVDGTGNVGIGSTSPTQKLDVNGSIQASSFLDQQNNAFFIDPASSGIAATFNGSVGIGTSNPSSFMLQVAGNVGPQTTNLYDVGSSLLRWKDLWLAGNSTIAGNETVTGTVTAGNLLLSSTATYGGFWQRFNGAVSPFNLTDDLLIGSTSTSSAKFAVLNIANGTPVASISSGLNGNGTYFDANGNIQTVRNAPLTLGGNTTGAVVFGSNVASNILPKVTNTYDLGSLALQWNNVYANNIYQNGQPLSQVWQRNFGVLSPLTITDDVAVGGTSTTSAKFQIFGLTGNATTAGTLTFNTNGTIQTTSMLPLVLGSATTGSIQLSPKGTTGLFVNGTGNVGINTINPSVFPLQVAGNAGPDANNAYDLGSSSLRWKDLWLAGNATIGGNANITGDETVTGTITAGNLLLSSGSTYGGFFQRFNGVISPINITDDFAIGGTSTTSAKFQIFGDTGNATTTGTLTFTANGIIQTTSMLPLVLGSATTGSIQLSPKGTTGLFVDGTGNVGVNTITPNTNLQIGANGQSLFIGDNTNTSANISVNNHGLFGYDGSFATVQGAGGNGIKLNVNNGTFGNGTALQINTNGFVDIGTTTVGNAQLTVNQTGNAGTGDIFTASSSGVTKFIISNTGNISVPSNVTIDTLTTIGTINIATGANTSALVLGKSGSTIRAANLTTNGPVFTSGGNGTLNSESFIATNQGGLGADVTPAGAGEILYSNSSTTYAHLAAAISVGLCLTSNGSAAPSWTTCATGAAGTNWWQVIDGAISPINNSLDLLIGSNATASAKFAVLNVGNSATPVASISSGLNGTSMYIAANGQIQTTNFTGLTIGGNTTGNITLSPQIGNGTVTIDGIALNTTAASFDLLNTIATNINFASAAATLQIGAAGGTTLFGSGTIDDSQPTVSLFTLPTALNIGGTNQTTTLEGNTVLGASPANTITSNGLYATDLVPNGNGSINLGSPTHYYNVVYANTYLSPVGGGVSGYWSLASNVLSPVNSWNDLAIGGTATGSATPFQIFATTVGVNTAGTATTSGNITFRGVPAAQTAFSENILNGGTFAIQTSVGGDSGLTPVLSLTNSGDLSLAAANITTSATSLNLFNSGVLSANILNGATGLINLGNAGGTIGIPSHFASNIVPDATNNRDLGSTSLYWRAIYGIGITANSLVLPATGGVGGYWTLGSSVLHPTNLWNDLAIGGTATGSATPFQIFSGTIAGQPAGTASTSGNLSFRSPFTNINLLNGAQLGFYTSVGGEPGIFPANPALYIASSSAGIRLGIGTNTPNFPLDISGGGSALAINNGNNTTANIAFSGGTNSTGRAYVGYDGSFAVLEGASGHGIKLFVNSGSSFGSGTVGLEVAGTTGYVMIGTTTTGNAALTLNQTNTSGLGDIFTASASGTTKFTIANDGTIKNSLIPNLNDTYDLGSDPNFGGNEWNNLYVRQIFSNSIGGTSGYWQLNNGAIAPTNVTNDVLIGAISTASATFHVYGSSIGQGTNPVASVAAHTSFAGLVVDNTVGDLITASSSGQDRFVVKQNGNVGIGIDTPANTLQVAGDFQVGKDATPWGVSGYSQRRQISITNNSGAALTNYQVRIVIDTASLISAGKMLSNCNDIRFTDTDGSTNLNFWMENACNTNYTTFWVNVPTIGYPQKTIYAYYNNTGASNASSTTGTFVREITGVQAAYRLDEPTYDPIADFSGNGNVATASGTTVLTSGKFANARTFNGTTDYITASDSASLRQSTPMSISVWAKWTSTTADSVIVRKDTTTGTRYFYGINANPVTTGSCTGGTGKVSAEYFNGTAFKACSTAATYNDGNWHHLVMTISGTTVTLYVDGVAQAQTNTITGIQNPPTGELDLGAAPPYTAGGPRSNYFAGSIDGVRVYNAALTSAQITDLYGSGGNNYGLVTVDNPGKEEVAAYTATAPGTYLNPEQSTLQTIPSFYVQNTTGDVGLGTLSLASTSARLSVAGDIKSGLYDTTVWGSNWSNYSYRAGVTVDNTQSASSSANANYVVRVITNTAAPIANSKMRSDCGDIRFADADGNTSLSYWIETGSCNTSNTVINVKVPLLPPSAKKNIYMYYGNPSVVTTSSTNVFNSTISNLSAAYRFDETTAGSSATDFSGNSKTATASGTTISGGYANNARSFNGTSDFLEMPLNILNGHFNNFSVSVWFRTFGSGVIFGLQDGQPPAAPPSSWNPVLYVDTNGKLEAENYDNTVLPIVSSTVVNDGVWHHAVLVTSSSTRQDLYLDGVNIGNKTTTISVQSAMVATIGTGYANFWPNTNNSWYYFNGQIDEFSLYNGTLSSTDVTNLYNNKKGYGYATPNSVGNVYTRTFQNPEPVVTVGSEQDPSQVNSTLYVNNTLGRVGIGTANPTQTLEIAANSFTGWTGAHFDNLSAGGTGGTQLELQTDTQQFNLGVGSSGGSMANKFFIWDNTAGAFRLAIDSSGNVGIGSTSPTQKLDVNGSIQASSLFDQQNNAYFIDPASSGTAGDFNGAVAIGTTTPLAGTALSVGGVIAGTSTVNTKIGATGTTTGNGNNSSIYFVDSSGTTRGRLDTSVVGNGVDGSITISANPTTFSQNQTTVAASGGTAGNSFITTASTASLEVGDEIVIIQMAGTGVGNWETKYITGVQSTTVFELNAPLTNSYTSGGGFIQRIPQYTTVHVTSAGLWQPQQFNGGGFGIIFFRAQTVTIDSGGSITASGLGATGGVGSSSGGGAGTGGGISGTVIPGTGGSAGSAGTAGSGSGAGSAGGGGGGGAGEASGHCCSSGGGGGSGSNGGGGNYGGSAITGTGVAGGGGGGGNPGAAGGAPSNGNAGATAGSSNLVTSMYLGSGGGGGGKGGGGGGGYGSGTHSGGSGSTGANGGAGGNGGGIIFINAETLTNNGTISSNGATGTAGSSASTAAAAGQGGSENFGAAGGSGGGAGGGGGGGSGGAILLNTTTITAVGTISAAGGAGAAAGTGGNGGQAQNFSWDGNPSCFAGAGGAGGGGSTGGTHGAQSVITGGGGSCSATTNAANGGSGGTHGDGGVGRIECAGADCSGASPTESTASLLAPSSVNNGYGVLHIGSIDTFNADLAENYISGDPTIEPGDVVAISNRRVLDDNSEQITTKGVLRKASGNYDRGMIGVVSTSPGLLLGTQDGSGTQSAKTEPLALSGRVPVKVSTENGDIHIGDSLTASNTQAGVAVKQLVAGPSVGKAMEDYTDNTQIGTIDVFVNTSWFDPQVYLTTTGDLNLTDTTLSGDYALPHSFNLTDALNNPINRMAAYAEAVVGSLRAGVINSQQIFTNSLAIATDNVSIAGSSLRDYILNVVRSSDLVQNGTLSPIADVDQLHVNLISPLASNSAIALDLQGSQFTIRNSATGSAVASIDNTGNATFSGTLASKNLTVNADATISGTLHAGKIVADDIEGLSAKVGTLSAQNITNVTNIYFATGSAGQSSNNNLIGSNYPSGSSSGLLTPYLGYTNLASYSGFLAYVPNLSADTAMFDQGLMSLGTTSLADTTITGQLSIGTQLILADNSINVLGSSFEIQPLRQGGVNFEGGLLAIDTDGNLTVNGNAVFSKNLAANIISPLANDRDLNFKLGENSTATGSALATSTFAVQNASGSGIFAINQLGDIMASGAANIGKLNFNLVQPALAVSNTEVIATGSAGTTFVKAHQTEITIDNQLVTDKSLIYITPVGQSNVTPYLLRQVDKASFTVGIPVQQLQDTIFNWLIIN